MSIARLTELDSAGTRTRAPAHEPATWAQMEPRLLELAREGMSARLIGGVLSREFGRVVSKNAVIGRAFRNGLSISSDPKRTEAARAARAEKARASLARGTHKPAPVAPMSATSVVVRAELPDYAEPAISVFDRVYGPASMIDIRRDQCRYIAGAPGAPDEPTYCGMKTSSGTSYCENHRLVCHVRAPKSAPGPFRFHR